ncbi:MAG: ABC transporter permease [Acidobacteriaceae bacterium]|nr:ABC transporter permease [Acidobacteriaceae bacterium]
MWSQLKIAARTLRHTPGFALLTIAILGLGIGATTAMFSITRTVLLKPLAYRDPERLVSITFRVPQFSKLYSTIPVNAQHFLLFRDHSRTLEEITLLRPDGALLTGAGEATQIRGLGARSNFFRMLGVRPALGRGFITGEDQLGRDGVVVISNHLWQENFGGRRDILGRTIRLDGRAVEVIGVLAPAFPLPRAHQLSEVEPLPEHPEYIRPLVFSEEDLGTPLGNENYLPIARLRPGATPAQALADLTALEKVISKRYPEPVEFDPVVRPLQQAMAREVRLPLLVLMAAVCAVMLIVCINLMNLMTVRAVAQRREWAIRLAVGAGLRDLIGGALLESLILSGVGALLGSALTLWFLQLVRLKAPVDLPRIDELGFDPSAFAFALVLAFASALLFGVLPAWRAAQIDPQEALQSGGRSAAQGRKGRRAGQILVAAEVALSCVLLLTSGLFLHSFVAILGVSPGVDVHHLLTVAVKLPFDKYHEQAQMFSFYDHLRQQVSAMPGVEAAGYVSDLPLAGEDNNNPATAADRAIPPVTQWPMTSYVFASTAYFRAAGIPLKDGRVFEQRDGKAREVLISANLAAHVWPHQSAVGRPIRIYGNKEPLQVVGVVGAVHAGPLTQAATNMIYFPDWQQTQTEMSLFVRTANEPENLSSAIRNAILHLEPDAAIPSIQTMRQLVSNSVSQKRFQVILLTSFAVAALLLASLGIYGVLAFATGRRTSEIGIRMAMGARPVQILNMSLRSGMGPVIAGVVVGVLTAAVSARLIQNLLFEVRALDPLVYSGTCVLLLAVAALACFIPARRASRLNPVEALRNE